MTESVPVWRLHCSGATREPVRCKSCYAFSAGKKVLLQEDQDISRIARNSVNGRPNRYSLYSGAEVLPVQCKRGLRARSWILLIFCQELADEKYFHNYSIKYPGAYGFFDQQRWGGCLFSRRTWVAVDTDKTQCIRGHYSQLKSPNSLHTTILLFIHYIQYTWQMIDRLHNRNETERIKLYMDSGPITIRGRRLYERDACLFKWISEQLK